MKDLVAAARLEAAQKTEALTLSRLKQIAKVAIATLGEETLEELGVVWQHDSKAVFKWDDSIVELDIVKPSGNDAYLVFKCCYSTRKVTSPEEAARALLDFESRYKGEGQITPEQQFVFSEGSLTMLDYFTGQAIASGDDVDEAIKAAKKAIALLHPVPQPEVKTIQSYTLERVLAAEVVEPLLESTPF